MRKRFISGLIITSALSFIMGVPIYDINAEESYDSGDILFETEIHSEKYNYNSFDPENPSVLKYIDEDSNVWTIQVVDHEFQQLDKNDDGIYDYWITNVKNGDKIELSVTSPGEDIETCILLDGYRQKYQSGNTYSYNPEFSEDSTMDIITLSLYGDGGVEEEWCPITEITAADVYIVNRYANKYDLMPNYVTVCTDDYEEFSGTPRDVCRKLEKKYQGHTFDINAWSSADPTNKWVIGEVYFPMCGVVIDGEETSVFNSYWATLMDPILSVQVDDVELTEGDYQERDGYSIIDRLDPEDPYSGVPGPLARVWIRGDWKAYDATPKHVTITLDESVVAEGEDNVISGSFEEVRAKLAEVLDIEEYNFQFEVIDEQTPDDSNMISTWTVGSNKSTLNVMGVVAEYNVEICSDYGDYTGFVPIKAADGTEDYWYIKKGKIQKTFSGTACGTIDGVKQWWVVKNGKVIKDYTGFALVGSSWMYYKNGKINKAFTGTVCGKINGVKQWWYVRNGKVMTGYTGLAIIGTSTMYFENGAVNKSFSGSYRFKGKVYKIKNGKVVK